MAGAPDDAQLITRYGAGDAAAFDVLYDRHKGSVYRYFLRQSGDPEAAAELSQGTWSSLIKARERTEPAARFTTFLYQAGHQCLVDHYRKSGKSLTDGANEPAADEIPDPLAEELDPAFASARWSLVDWEQGAGDGAPGSDAANAPAQRAARLKSALDALPLGQREVFLLHEEARMGLAEIAAVTGARPESVKNQLGHAVRKLGGALDAFVARQSPLSADYAALETVQPPEVLDAKILAAARLATAPAATREAATKATATKPAPPVPNRATPQPTPQAAHQAAPATGKTAKPDPAPRPAPARVDDDADDDDDAPATRRPRWLLPAGLAALVLVAAGVGVSMLNRGSPDSAATAGDSNPLGSLFAQRARERSDAGKASAEAAAAQDAAATEAERAPLPPPPVFEPEGPQVQDLDIAIALIRKELVLANQQAEAAAAAATPDAAPASAPPAGATAEAGAASVIQPRDRRLTKILELHDGGNPDLAADSLEIFLRDFEDDPISKRILDAQPRDTDVAVE